MSDDVKVKFGGDFTDVSKGAQTASQKAGAAMGAWVGEFTSGIKNSLVNMASLTFIFDKVKEGISGAIERVFELNRAIRKTSVDAQDFQRVFAITKQFGIDVETTGTAISFFSKMMGQAAMDTEKHGKALKELGFTNKEIKEGTISASDALIALAGYLEQTGSEYKTAALAAELFGKKTGKELLVAIREGSGALKDQAENAKILTAAQLQAAESTERAWTRVFLKLKAAWISFIEPIIKDTGKFGIQEAREEITKENKAKNLPTSGLEFEKQVAIRAKQKGADYAFQQEIAKENFFQNSDFVGKDKLEHPENFSVKIAAIQQLDEAEKAAKKAAKDREDERVAKEEADKESSDFEKELGAAEEKNAKARDEATNKELSKEELLLKYKREAAELTEKINAELFGANGDVVKSKELDTERVKKVMQIKDLEKDIASEKTKNQETRMAERIRIGEQLWREDEENAKALAEASKGLAVSSLQSIGGGDIASIGMLGPQEKIEMNTASAAASLRVIETHIKPATPGAPTIENKAK